MSHANSFSFFFFFLDFKQLDSNLINMQYKSSSSIPTFHAFSALAPPNVKMENHQHEISFTLLAQHQTCSPSFIYQHNKTSY